MDINHSKIFYDPPSIVMEIKAKINKKVKVKSLSRVQLLATPWTVAYYGYSISPKGFLSTVVDIMVI